MRKPFRRELFPIRQFPKNDLWFGGFPRYARDTQKSDLNVTAFG